MAEGGVIVDSAMDFAGSIAGTAAPREVIESLCLISVRYVGFDGRLHEGQLVVHRELAADLGEIFALMEILKFPVAGAVPIVRYGWSDEASMAADNTSAFNYRRLPGRTGFPAMRRDGRSTSTRGGIRRSIRTAGSPRGSRLPARQPGDLHRTNIRWCAPFSSGDGAGEAISPREGLPPL